MVKEKNSNKEIAFEMYKKTNGKISLKEIALALDVKEGTVRSWKNRYKWDATLCNEKCNVAQKKNSVADDKKVVKPLKNKAYKMSKDSYPLQARPNNKNAVSTGEYETILFDSMDETELQLINSIQENKKDLLLKEIQLLTVRERRMLKRIENLKQEQLTLVSQKIGTEKGQPTSIYEYEATLGKIQNIEEALSRVQDKKIKAIDSLHKFEMDEYKIELELMKFETNALKDIEENEETEDDGFIEALKSEIDKVWEE